MLAALALAASGVAQVRALPETVLATPPGAFDAFGGSVALSGGTWMFVGCRGADGAAGTNSGAIEVHERVNGAWAFRQRPAATGLAAGDQLGEAVAGNATFAIAGASRHDAIGADAGAVWVFKRATSTWAFHQKLVPAAGSAGARFGSAVAISTNALAVGAPAATGGGAVSVYKQQIGSWISPIAVANPTPNTGDSFGAAVAVTDTWLAVGAPFDDAAGTDAGAVHLFLKTPVSWNFHATVVAASPTTGGQFGNAVAISGTRLAIGSPGGAGRVEIHDLSGSTWSRSATVTSTSPSDGANFGTSVAIDGGSLLVGSPGANSFAGDAQLFLRDTGGAWNASVRVGPAAPEPQDFAGTAVAISGGLVAVGTPLGHPSTQYRGLVASGDLAGDCNANGVNDLVELAQGAPDCDANLQLDACQADGDSDGAIDACDGCPTDPAKTAPGTCGCGTADADGDGDGVLNCLDGCPADPLKIAPGTCGCGVPDADSDGDGTANCLDGCPADPAKIAAGACGCGVADTDSDGDGTANCLDGCPADPTKVVPGACGCGVPDADGDGDGVLNCLDGCPADPAKVTPGTCGCGYPDADANGNGTIDCVEAESIDTDGDGVTDDDDLCPFDATKASPGTCGCGTPDVDTDGDGLVDCTGISVVPQLGLLATTGVLSGDDFGAAIAMDGTLAVVGLPLDDLPGKSDAGSARVFEWNGSAWALAAELAATPADAKSKDYFGQAVAIHGDVIVVGAPGSDVSAANDAGAAYVFRRSGSAWAFEARLTRATPAGTDLFGTSVAVRGEFIAVGAPQANFGGLGDSGEVRVFKRAAATWTGTAALSGVPPTGGDRFGQSVALGGAVVAPTLVAGCPADDETGKSNCGAVYAMPLSTAGVATSVTRLLGNPAYLNGAMGTSVAIDGDGIRIAGGAPTAAPTGIGSNGGSVTAWTLSGATWTGVNLSPPGHATLDRLGRSVGFDPTGSTLVAGDSTRKQGTITSRGGAVVWSRLVSGAWSLHDRLVVNATGSSGSQFGFAVAAGPNGILVGGPKNAPGGAVAVFAAPVACAATDSDGDGTGDACDDCPSDPNKISPGICGCGAADTDGDGDGMANCYDACPSDPAKTAPGLCGCGVSEIDTDGDGARDCLDADDDNDGTVDAGDGCPLDPIKTAPGQCGCGAADTDTDADGTADCNDLCPSDPGKIAPGTCGCGTPDVDADADGLMDCFGQGTLSEAGSLPTTGVLSGDDFGYSVSGDGNFALVGLPLDDLTGKTNAGTARISEWTGSSWVERASLLAPSADAKANDNFGWSVSIQGDVAVVGAPLADLVGATDAGAAYVFRHAGGSWTFEAKLTRGTPAATDRFGNSVAVLGEFIAVGVPQANAGGIGDSGEVRVFRRVAGAWTAAATVTAGTLASSDLFGQSVSLGGSILAPTLVVGCPGDDETGKAGCGAAYIHALTSSGTVSTVTRVISPAALTNAGLGASVTVDATGQRVASGAPLADVPGGGTDCGTVTVWSLSGSAWSGVEVTPADRAAGENFGRSVSLRADGQALVAGSPLDSVGGIAGRGSAVVLTFNGSSWSTYDRLTLPAAGSTSASNFGRAVAFRGSSILVGGPKHTPPAGGTVRSFGGP